MSDDGREEDARLAQARTHARDRVDGPGGDPAIPPLSREEIEAACRDRHV